MTFIMSRTCRLGWTFASSWRRWRSCCEETVADRLDSHWPISLSNGAAALFNMFLPLALVRILPLDQVGRYKFFFLYVTLSPGLFFVSGLTNGLYHWTGK